MAAHIELQLLSSLIEFGDMKTVLEEGITIDFFSQPEARAIFEAILTYYQEKDTRNIVPTWDWIYKRFPVVDFPNPSKRLSTRALCIETKEHWLRKKIETMLVDISDIYETEPTEALTELITSCKELQITTIKTRDIVLSDTIDEVKSEYFRAKNSTGYTGIPFPAGWGYHTADGRPKIIKKKGRQDHPLNEQTRGKQKGDFILFYGRPKSMKTWLLIDMAVDDYMNNHCRTLIFTKEMTPKQLRLRFVARILGVDYLAFKNGELTKQQEIEFLDLVEELKAEEERFKKNGKNCSLLITSGWTGKNSIDDLASLDAKIEEFEPDIAYVDAAYLFETIKGDKLQIWQNIKYVAYGLKTLANNRNIPLVATSQANRKGEETKGSTLSEIAYGDTLGQACDLAIRVIKRELEDGVKLACIISGGREVILPGFLLIAEPAIKFQLDQIFESQRQIQVQFRAEEEMIAAEEARAIKKLQGEGTVRAFSKEWR